MFPTLSRLASANIDIYQWILPDLSAENSWLPTLWSGKGGKWLARGKRHKHRIGFLDLRFQLDCLPFAGVAIIAGYILLRWNSVAVESCWRGWLHIEWSSMLSDRNLTIQISQISRCMWNCKWIRKKMPMMRNVDLMRHGIGEVTEYGRERHVRHWTSNRVVS